MTGPSEHRGWWRWLAGLVLVLFALYTVVVVVIAVTSGRAHARSFWPAVILMLLVAGWVVWRARLLLRSRGDGSKQCERW